MAEKKTVDNEGRSVATLRNTNRWDTKTLVSMALLCAIGVVLSFVELPLFPAAPFLKYDASAVPALLSGFSFGLGSGLAVGVVGAIIHGLLLGDFPGMIMNIMVVVGFVLPASFLLGRKDDAKHLVIGLVLSVVCSLLLAIGGNLIITPLYMGAPLEAVIAMIIPILIPFNLMKGVLNAVLTVCAYKALGKRFASPRESLAADGKRRS